MKNVVLNINVFGFHIVANVVLYGKLRFCERGISYGNSEVCKKATSFSLNQI
jgi:hypothetical protein